MIFHLSLALGRCFQNQEENAPEGHKNAQVKDSVLK